MSCNAEECHVKRQRLQLRERNTAKTFVDTLARCMLACVLSLTLSQPLHSATAESVHKHHEMALELLESGLKYESEGKFTEAKTAYERALKLSPKLDDAVWRLAHVEGKLGNWDSAIRHLEKLCRRHPKDERVFLALAQACLQAKQYERAVSAARTAVALRPNWLNGRLTLVEALSKVGDVDEAVKHLRVAVHISPNDPEIHLQLGRYYCELSKPERAIYHLRTAKRLAPNEPQPRLLLAKAYFELGMHQKTAEELKGLIELLPKDVQLLHDCARLLHDLGKTDEAVSYYRRLLHVAPYHDLARRELVDAYMQLGMHARALHHIRFMLRAKPNDDGLLKALSVCLTKLGRLGEAMDVLKRLLSIHGDDAIVLAELARLKMRLGNAGEAMNLYMASVKCASSSRSISRQEKLGIISEAVELALHMGDYEKVKALCEMAIPSDRENVRWRLLRARSLIELGKMRSAIASLQAILRKFGDCAEAKELLGFIHAWRFEWDEAEALFKEALEGNRRSFDATKALMTIYLCQGRYDDALNLVSRAESSGMDEVGVALLKCELNWAMGKSDLAISSLTKTKAFRRGDAEIILRLARLYLEMGFYEPALRHYSALIKRFNNDDATKAQLHLELAESFFRAGMFDRALTSIREALRLSKKDSDILLRYAYILMRDGKMKEAFSAMSDAVGMSDAEQTVSRFADMLVEHANGSFEKALLECARVWVEAPSRFVVDVATNLVLRKPISREFLSVLLKAFQTGDATPAQRKIALKLLGASYLSAGMNDSAIATLQDAFSLAPWDASYAVSLAEAYSASGDAGNAEKYFLWALRTNPRAYEIRERYIRFLMNQKRFGEAQTHIRIAMSLGAPKEVMYPLMVECSHREGRLRELISSLSKHAMRNMDDLALAIAVAEGYEMLGEYKRALQYWRRACGLTKASVDMVKRLAGCLERAKHDEEAKWAWRFVANEERMRSLKEGW